MSTLAWRKFSSTENQFSWAVIHWTDSHYTDITFSNEASNEISVSLSPCMALNSLDSLWHFTISMIIECTGDCYPCSVKIHKDVRTCKWYLTTALQWRPYNCCKFEFYLRYLEVLHIESRLLFPSRVLFPHRKMAPRCTRACTERKSRF